jgi:hypothetical protein
LCFAIKGIAAEAKKQKQNYEPSANKKKKMQPIEINKQNVKTLRSCNNAKSMDTLYRFSIFFLSAQFSAEFLGWLCWSLFSFSQGA